MAFAPKRKVAFLFLGETLLIPHLFPIVEALMAAEPELPIDIWVSTSVHEELIGGWLNAAAGKVLIRRAPGYITLPPATPRGTNPPLPGKLPMLARLAPRLARVPVVVCAEQTSLWLPRLLPMRTRFVNTLHGAGSMMTRGDKRRRAAWLTLVPSERERRALAENGVDPETVAAVGYIKAGFKHRVAARPAFSQQRPVILYTPHWQRHRSSWWEWGKQAVAEILKSGRYNLIFAPHQRLAEKDPGVRAFAANIGERGDTHCDLESFAMVDGSYTEAADIYLGDTSSQVVEFLMRPRPCVFLDPQDVIWQQDPSYAMWAAGEVVTRLSELNTALNRAAALHPKFVAAQREFAVSSLGDVGGNAPARAAQKILSALD